MREYKVGDHVLASLSGGRIVEATIKAIVETTEGVRLQVSFGDETAPIIMADQPVRCLKPVSPCNMNSPK